MNRPTRWIAGALVLATGSALGVPRALSRTGSQSATTEPSMILAARAAPPVLQLRADTLRHGETLSQLLERSSLELEHTRALLAAITEYQDPRHLKPGAVLRYTRAERSGDVRDLSFQVNADEQLLLQRHEDTWNATVDEVPVRSDTVLLAGTIRSSLYATLLRDENLLTREETPALVDQIADGIFAWQIDFSSDVKAGDRYQLLYERKVRPDGTVREGRILTALFHLSGREYSAYRYESGTRTTYYDRNGESLKRAFLRAPLEYRRISSSYSTGRFHPVLKKNRAHKGVDYAASSGTPIRAVADGVVRTAGWNRGGYGNLIEIRHSRGYATKYAHLKGFARGVRSGSRVQQGQIIGYVGSTGMSTGPHLHYEFHHNGVPVNPTRALALSDDPVPNREKNRFTQIVRQRDAEIRHYTPTKLALGR